MAPLMNVNELPPHHIEVLYDETAIAARVDALAARLADDYGDEPLTVVALLRGSFIFAADMIRAMARRGMRLQVEFMTLSSYGSGTQSSGEVKLMKSLDADIQSRHVLLMDDILETGRTLSAAINLLQAQHPKSVKLAVLLHKPGKIVIPVTADYEGFVIEDRFVVGYGLDYDGYYRELPFIGNVINL